MKLTILYLIVLFLSACGETTSDGGGGGGTNTPRRYCSTGFCYSYLEQICCPRSAPYACNGRCYTYSGGGSCTNYKTTC